MSSIFLISGDDQINAKLFLDNLLMKYAGYEKIVYEASVSLQVISQEFRSLSFQGKKVMICFNVWSSNSRQLKTFLKPLARSENGNILIFFEGKKVDGRKIGSEYKDIMEINEFNIPNLLFKFLDGLKPNNTSVEIGLLQKLASFTSTEFIFAMMIRQFRLLILLGNKDSQGNLESLKMAPWQIQKLKNQARYFEDSNVDLQNIYRKLLDIDFKNKTGQLPLGLSAEIDFLLANI